MIKQLLCLFFLFLSGCDDSSSYSRNEDTSTTTNSLESIQISLGNHLKGRSDIIVHERDVQEFIAIGTFSDGTQKEITDTVSWFYSPEHLVKNHEFGDFTFKHVGLLTLNASLSDVTSNELEVEITPAELKSIQLTPSENEVPIGKKVQMRAIGSYSDDTTLDLTDGAEWTSKNPSIASVNQLGVVTPISEGSTVIIVSKGDKKTETTKFVVTSVVLDELKLEPLSVETPMGKNVTMTAKARYSGNDQLEELELIDLTWTSTNENVATVISGVVTPKSVGNTTITVMKDGKNAETTRFAVTSAILESIQIRGDIEAPVGSITELTAIGTYSDNVDKTLTEASWISSNPAIATVVNGEVTPKTVGITQITVTKDAEETSIEFTVTEATLASISLTPASSGAIDVSIRKNITMQAKGIYTNQAELPLTDGAWTSSDESVATVVDGVVAPISMGEVTIKVIKDHKEASQLFSVTSDKYPCNGEEGNYYCLPIVESKTQKGLYFTSTPDKYFSKQYGFGDAYAFYSDADGFQGLMLPPYIAESGSESWCKELNKITYGGRSNWVESTSSQLSQLYSDYGNMFDKFGWPIGVDYYGSYSDGGKLINLATGEVNDPVFFNSYYTSCSSLPL